MDDNTIEPNDPMPDETPTDIEAAIKAQSAGQTEQQKAEDYIPNFTYEINGEEQQFDDALRGALTNKQTEELLRDLYVRSKSYDGVKKDYDEVMTRSQGFENDYKSMSETISQVAGLAKNDLSQFFQVMKIPPEQVYKWVYEQIEYQQADPNVRAQYDQQQKMKTDYMAMQNQLHMQQQKEVESHQAHFDQAMSTPQIVQVEKDFDQKNQPGAFRNLVKSIGMMEFQRSGIDLPPAEICHRAMQMLGLNQPTPAEQPVNPPQQQQPSSPLPQQQSKQRDGTSLPNIGGDGSVTPTTPDFKNTDELRKYVESKFGY